MGSLNPENDPKQELDDSGYVQEDAAGKEVPSPEMGRNSANLLDLSDDVLLYILQYCSPIDLKALGFTCPRLGTLVLDRTLWQAVDARETPTGKRRMRWMLTHALTPHTTSLKLSGYAREVKGCLGYVNRACDDPPTHTSQFQATGEGHKWAWNSDDLESRASFLLRRYTGAYPYHHHHASVGHASELGGATARGPAPEEEPACGPAPGEEPDREDRVCPGPQVTLSQAALRQLAALCPALAELALEHVVIDCATTKVCMFPVSLRVLSLVGTRCFNADKSFLNKIQDHLVHLEELDVSECDWVEPACMLPLSKLPRLARLRMRLCDKLTEFVAYASLATRYGFKQLKVVDLRGSPVGDSEVSALGWVPNLEELYLSPAPPAPASGAHSSAGARAPPSHAHFMHDPPPAHRDLHPWEEQEPDYYKSKYEMEEWIAEENFRPNWDWKQEAMSCLVLHHLGRTDAGPSASSSSDRANERPPTPQGTFSSKNGVRQAATGRPARGGARGPAPDRDSRTLHELGTTIYRKRYRQTDDDTPTKHFKGSSEVQNEPSSSSVDEPSSSNSQNVSCTSRDHVNNEPTPSGEASSCTEPMSSSEPSEPIEPSSSLDKSSNECDSSDKNKDVPSKGSRKHFDPTYQVSRSTLKYCLDDFKKRTEGGDMTDDSDDEPSFDDDDDDDSPQTKRCRPNEAGTSKSDVGSCKSEPKKSNSKCDEPDSTQKHEPNPSTSKDSNDPGMKARTVHSRDAVEDIIADMLDQYRDTLISSQPPQESLQNQPQPRFVTFRRNRPPVFLGSGQSHQPAVGDTNPPVVVGDLPMEGCRAMPPVVVVAGDNRPPVVVRCENQQAVVMGCNHNRPVVMGGDNQPAVVVGCGNRLSFMSGENQPSIVVGCGHNQPPAGAGCSGNQPAFMVGYGNQPAVVVGCGHHDDNQNIHNNNDVQQPDWNNRLNMQGLNLEGQRQEVSRTMAQPSSSDGDAAPSQGNAAPAQGDAEPSQSNSAPTQGNAAPTQGNAAPAENAENPNLSRHRILYINVGRRRHAMYQISMPEPLDMLSPPLTAAMNLIYSSHIAPRLEYTSLVTDAAIRRFGRADGENINYVQIGPMGPAPAQFVDPHARPNRSNLRILSVTGFRHITNSSLMHLATAAPHLQSIDFTGTRVTETGVEHFRNFRPECRVRYGPLDKPKEDCGRPHSR